MKVAINRLLALPAVQQEMQRYEVALSPQQIKQVFQREVAEKVFKYAIDAASYRAYRINDPDMEVREMPLELWRQHMWNKKLLRRLDQLIQMNIQHGGFALYVYKPYSRTFPHPPMDPGFLNIQSGELLAGLDYEVRLRGRSVEFHLYCWSDHLNHIVASMTGADTKMMERPYLNKIRDEYRRIANNPRLRAYKIVGLPPV